MIKTNDLEISFSGQKIFSDVNIIINKKEKLLILDYDGTLVGFENNPLDAKPSNDLYDLLKWGPTSFNCSPMRLKFLKSKQAKENLSRFVSEDNVSKVLNAPVCTIIGMDIEFWRDLPKNYLREDAKQYFENCQL